MKKNGRNWIDLTMENDLEATYQQSLVLDRLVEEYLDLQSA